MGNSVITKKISSALEVKTSFTSDRKPAMIVIDEIDVMPQLPEMKIISSNI